MPPPAAEDGMFLLWLAAGSYGRRLQGVSVAKFGRIGHLVAGIGLGLLAVAVGAVGQVVPPPGSTALPLPVSPVAHIETRGSGPVHLILVPGINCDWTIWESFMARNGERYTMHAVTLPGFGGSGPANIVMGTPYSATVWLDNARRAAVRVADDLKLEKPLVVGHGMGGAIALDVGIQNGDRVAGVVSIEGLAAIPLSGPDEQWTPEKRRIAVDGGITDYFSQQPEERFHQERARNIASMTSDQAMAAKLKAMFDKVSRPIAMRYLLEVMATDLRPALASMTTPALVVGAIPPLPEGAKPESLEPARSTWRGQFAKAPSVTLVLIEGSRHLVMEDQPKQLDDAIAGFVAGLKRTGEGR